VTQATTAVRLALVGAGRMGSVHARALARTAPEVELAAVVEPADEAVARLGAAVARFRHTGELLARGGVDGAIVAVPTRLHRAVVSELLDSGVPVLCEKPCGLTSDETAALAQRARAAGLPLHIGYWRRFVPGLRELRGRIERGALGEVELVFCAQWDERAPAASFRDPAASGGIVVDMGVHEFDQLRWLTGQEVADVTGAASSVWSEPPVEGDPESVSLAVWLSGGATALVSLARRHPPGDVCRVEVVGTRAAARLEFLAPPHGDETLLAALSAQARDFAAAIGGAASAGASADDATRALAAAERARAALSL
jgi:myo-inositol 2-dehydrogenase/D-chiro-inositol 1-dehydrogenase